MSTHPRVLAVQDACRNAGIRTKLVQEFERGGPDLAIARGGKNKACLWVNRGEADPSRPQIPLERERFINWVNYGQSSPVVPMGAFVSTPAEALAQANFVYVPPSLYPTIILAPVNPSGAADAFVNAFKHNLFGQASALATMAPDRVLFSEAQESTVTVPQVISDVLCKAGDTGNRAEHYITTTSPTSLIFQQNDQVDINFEVAFPSDFPSLASNQYIHVVRLSAFTNGLPPIEFIARKDGSGAEKVWLRENGSAHDLASQTSLDATGGYVWSTPLVRATSYSAMNWLKLTLRIFFDTNPATGWFELYQNYNLSTPIVARTFKQTLTDTSGTVRCYLRYGQNRFSGVAVDSKVQFTNVRYTISRPP